jgi:RNA polymerase sigma-70 factor (ECF subfamily)
MIESAHHDTQQSKMLSLVFAIKNGNSDAFAELFRTEFRNIKFFAHQYLNDLAQAEDIAQETFLSLWTNRTTIADNSNLKALLLTIAKNKSLNVLRSQRHYRKDTIEKSETQLNIKALNHPHIEAQIDATTLSEAIEQARNSLPEHIRTSFDLSRLENKTYNEIAEIKGISVKSVEYHLAVALKHFREKLTQYTMVVLIFYFIFQGVLKF